MDHIDNWDMHMIMLTAASTPLGRKYLDDYEYQFYRGYVSGIYTYLRGAGHGKEISASPDFVDLGEIESTRKYIDSAVDKEMRRLHSDWSRRS